MVVIIIVNSGDNNNSNDTGMKIPKIVTILYYQGKENPPTENCRRKHGASLVCMFVEALVNHSSYLSTIPLKVEDTVMW